MHVCVVLVRSVGIVGFVVSSGLVVFVWCKGVVDGSKFTLIGQQRTKEKPEPGEQSKVNSVHQFMECVNKSVEKTRIV